MSIYLVEGERTVKQRVWFFVDAVSDFNASEQCRKGLAFREFVLETKPESNPTNFKHLGIWKPKKKEEENA